MSSNELIDNFYRYFCLIPANTAALKEEVYRLRYDVYCVEFGYEPAANFPDKMEHDEYDEQSFHVLVKHNATELAAGCTRLIQTADANPSRLLPFEKICKGSLDLAYISNLGIPRHSICDASRFFGDITSLTSSSQELRTFPLISLSIALATTALTELTHRPYMYAMMEPFLPRLLHRIGYNFIKVSPDIAYHGNRAAYVVKTSSVLANLQPELFELYKTIRNRLDVLVRTAA